MSFLYKKIHIYYLLTAFFYIFFYLIITPPFYVADEASHFNKASSKEQIYLFGSVNNDEGVINFTEHYEKIANNKHLDDRNFRYDFGHINRSSKKFFLQSKYSVGNTGNMTGYPFTGYIFSKAGFSFSKFFTPKIIYNFYSSRLFNFFFSILVCFLIIKNINLGKEYLITILCLPMTFSLFGSCSQDVMIIVYTLLLIFFSNKILEQKPNFKNELSIALIIILCLFIIMARPTYLSFIILPTLFIIKFSQKKLFQFTFLIFVIFCISLFISNYPSTPKTNDINLPNDLFFFLKIAFNDLIINGPKYLILLVGGLGRIDIFPSLIIILLLLLLIFLQFLISFDFKKIFSLLNISIFTIFASTVFLTQMAQYMHFTEAGRIDYIQGVQGRYFIPIFMILSLVLNKNLNNNIIKQLKNYSVLFVPHINFIVLIKLYSFFY